MSLVWGISYLILWALVLVSTFMLIGVLRAQELTKWRIDTLEAINPTRVGRAGIKLGKKAPDFDLPSAHVRRAED